VTGVVGSFQAAEVIKMLLMPKADVGGRLLAVDVKDGQTRTMRFNRDVDCPICSVGARAVLRDDDYAMPMCADD
jgi:adenylyltransferase/sulfurtransferase